MKDTGNISLTKSNMDMHMAKDTMFHNDNF